MYEIELTGLLAHKPVAALSVYGLYVAIPDCLIYYKSRGAGSYYPVLKSQYQNIDELAEFLCSKTTWSNLNIPPKINSLKKGKTKFALNDFEKLLVEDEVLAAGLATDLKLEDKNGICVKTSPFYLLSRQATLCPECEKTLSLLEIENTKDCLTKFPWDMIEGQNYGFFAESVSGNVFKNDLSKGTFKSLTVPILCLLSIAAWRTLPCFMSGRDVMTAGCHKDFGLNFTYPIFTKPQTRLEAVSWLCNSMLKDSKNRLLWKNVGITAVFESKFKKVTQKESGYLRTSKRI